MASLDYTEKLAARHLNTIGAQTHQGICVPLFCVRTKGSLGIGDFGDLIALIRLTAKLKLSILQLLPMNDTLTDSSPYSSISAFALNPVYIDLRQLPSPPKSKRLASCDKHLRELDCKDHVHYNKVRDYKLKWLRIYFEKKRHLKKIQHPLGKFAQAEKWAHDFALFCALKAHYEKPWWKFPKSYRNPTPQIKKMLKERFKEEIDFILFVQWVCYEQLKRARLYAEKKRVFLKGDVPFLLAKDSADVWLHATCFHLTRSTGTQPDRFNRFGQNWGFPPYNWTTQEKKCLNLWKARLKWQEHFYHLYRLDHAIGFFRVWTCKPNKSPQFGSFQPRGEARQLAQGEYLLEEFLKMSPLLPIAEDLGCVTKEMHAVFEKLGIPGTRVMKDMHHSSKPHFFYDPSDYPHLTMTTLGTHDMEVVAQWWKHHKKIAMHYARMKGWRYSPELKTSELKELLYRSYHTNSFIHISLLDEFLALFPKFVPTCLKRRQINIPGSWGEHNWSYRFIPTLEQLLRDQTFLRTVRAITKT